MKAEECSYMAFGLVKEIHLLFNFQWL